LKDLEGAGIGAAIPSTTVTGVVVVVQGQWCRLILPIGFVLNLLLNDVELILRQAQVNDSLIPEILRILLLIQLSYVLMIEKVFHLLLHHVDHGWVLNNRLLLFSLSHHILKYFILDLLLNQSLFVSLPLFCLLHHLPLLLLLKLLEDLKCILVMHYCMRKLILIVIVLQEILNAPSELRMSEDLINCRPVLRIPL
jgi:hypothetical protein